MPQETPFAIEPASILFGLDARTPQDAIDSLVAALAGVEAGRRKQLSGLVLAREEEASTFLGNGTALPHARTSLVGKLTMAVAITKDPVPWDESGNKAELIFLMAVPKTAIEEYLLTIRTLTHALRVPAAVDRLRSVKDAEGFLAVLAREIEAGAQYRG
jgi:mannitol/fructose-specific phosphotransferase system IIA component (Ntr-type)